MQQYNSLIIKYLTWLGQDISLWYKIQKEILELAFLARAPRSHLNLKDFNGWLTHMVAPKPLPDLKEVKRLWRRWKRFFSPGALLDLGEIRDKLIKRDGKRCQYCGSEERKDLELQVHHVFPKGKGGIDSFANCILACLKCNLEIGIEIRFPRNWQYGVT